MKIRPHNLDAPLLHSLLEDLRAVREAPARRKPSPARTVHVIALENGSPPPDLPRHAVRGPAPSPPAAAQLR